MSALADYYWVIYDWAELSVFAWLTDSTVHCVSHTTARSADCNVIIQLNQNAVVSSSSKFRFDFGDKLLLFRPIVLVFVPCSGSAAVTCRCRVLWRWNVVSVDVCWSNPNRSCFSSTLCPISVWPSRTLAQAGAARYLTAVRYRPSLKVSSNDLAQQVRLFLQCSLVECTANNLETVENT